MLLWGDRRAKRLTVFGLLGAALALPLLGAGDTGIASSSGPFPGFTGAPGEETCRHCHDTFPINPGGGELRIEGFPETYVPNETYPVTITLESPSGVKWGFQATVLGENRKRAGKVIVTDKDTTKVVAGIFEPNRRYLEQKRAGTFEGQRGAASWEFAWRAPKRAKGVITIHVSGNVANGNGEPTGDFIYYAEKTSLPATER
jgi:hypothetical protein